MFDPTGEQGYGRRGYGQHGFGHGFGPRGYGRYEAGDRPGDEDVGPGEGFGPGGRGFAPGGPRFGPGGPGFGPGGPGFGPGFGRGGWAFGPGGPGGWGHRGWHGGRGRRGRGNVRAAILALLAEEPRHGYSIMTELSERSGGLWRPSPGSVYPVLQQLQDEGLVTSTDSDGRKVFDLTAEGRRYVEDHADELRQPGEVADHGPRQRAQALMRATFALGAAVQQVARFADDEQATQALGVLEEARRAMYRILAVDAPAAGSGEDEPEPGAEPQG
ncbi:MAG TPA: PadR family transcriptional regulator [Kineosporiaceae bacterium]|nr:PadR family transcriptional regulator [Kineosporiaceae bacterium]